MSNVTLIIVMHELDLPGEGVVESTSLLLQRVLEVTDVLTVTVPADSLALTSICLLLGVEQRLHSLIVRTLRFHQVDDVELVSNVFLDILYPEVEPLRVVSGIVVVFQYQVIFVLSDFDSSTEVARLESAFKNEGVVIFAFFLVKGLQFVVISV
jgi:hypothetical protein